MRCQIHATIPLALSLMLGVAASAATFTPGNIVVLRVGDGTTTINNSATPVFIEERRPSDGNVVQTISIPTNGSDRLTVSGSSTTEGFLGRSVNQQLLTFAGYDADSGTTSIGTTSSSAVNRCLGIIDAAGNFSRISAGSAPFSGGNVRSAISDGTKYWLAGNATNSSSGMWFVAGPSSVVQIATGNFRVAKILNGSLAYSTGSSPTGVYQFTGLPTTVAVANQITTDTSPNDYAINPAGTVLYIADDRSLATGGGIRKWTSSAGTWTFKFVFGAANGLTAACRGLTVDFSGPNPILYATTTDTTTKLIKITDTSAFADTADTADQAAQLAIPVSNCAFRGVTLAPVQTVTAPTLQASLSGANVTITWPTNSTGYNLETQTNLNNTNWTAGPTSTIIGTNYSTTITNPTGSAFFRLKK